MKLLKKRLQEIFEPRKELRKRKTVYVLHYIDYVDKKRKKEKFVFDDALRYAKRWVENYKNHPRADWRQEKKISKEEDIFNKTAGIMGEQIILACFDQFKIPAEYSRAKYDYGDPRTLPYDFALAEDFKIEHKTVAPITKYIRAMVPGDQDISKFDYLLATKLYLKGWKMLTKDQVEKTNWSLEILEKVELAVLEGWLTREQVGKCYNPTYRNYQEFLSELNSMRHFWAKALRYSNEPEWREFAGKLMDKNYDWSQYS